MTTDGGSRGLRHDLRDVLVSLGRTADEVATTLQRSGVRGVRSDSRRCAIADYVHAVTGGDARVGTVGVGSRWLSVRGCRRWRPRTVLLLPTSARRFIRNFDAGRYPQLVRTESATGACGLLQGSGPGPDETEVDAPAR